MRRSTFRLPTKHLLRAVKRDWFRAAKQSRLPATLQQRASLFLCVRKHEKAQAAYTSPDYIEARKIGDKYGKLRIFAVEGVPQ